MAHERHLDRAIRGKRDSHRRERAIAALAARQHGVVSRRQLLRIGLSADAIDRWIDARRLHQLHRGVYAVGHRNVSPNGRYLAAVLFAGDGAALSHCSAADLWELRPRKEPEIDVIATTHRRGDATVRVRRDALDRSETMTRHGIRVTAAAADPPRSRGPPRRQATRTGGPPS